MAEDFNFENNNKILTQLQSKLSKKSSKKTISDPNKKDDRSRYKINNPEYNKVLIHNAKFIFSCNENDKLKILEDHSIIIENGIIKDIILSEEVSTEGYDLVFDAGKRGGLLITPGLINTHSHPPMYIMRSIMTLNEGEGLEETIAAMPLWERQMDDNDFTVGAIGDFTEQQRYGITTTLSHYGVFFPIENAARLSNHNVVNAISAVSNTHPENNPAMIKKLLEKFYKNKDGEKKNILFTTPALSLHYPYKATDEKLKEIKELVDKFDLLFTCHMAESEAVEKKTVEIHGVRETEFLDRNGLLTEKTLLSHNIHVDEKEIKKMIKQGVGISHLPTSNVMHKSGIFKFWDFYENGGFKNISLGTDGVVSKSRLDILSEAYQTRVTHIYKKTVKFGTLFKMMTANGARVLGMKNTGKLLPGMKADLAIWKMRDRASMPYDEQNPITLISNLITHGGRPVRDLMINGKFVIKNRRHQFIDESKLLDEIQKSHMKVRKKVGLIE